MNSPIVVDEFENESLPAETEALVAPEEFKYAPWHRPRKQYVRKKQWIRHTFGLIQRLKSENYFGHGAPLKYLTLPGPDLLDISLVTDVCEEEQVSIRYTGFCQTDEREETRLRRNLNEFMIQRQTSVFGGSKIVNCRIEEVAKPKSDARVAMEQGGPYDVINIDACGPIGPHEDPTGTLVQAIRSIADFQLRSTRHPFVLFLTTPVQTDSISKNALAALHRQIVTNARNDSEFSSALIEQLSGGDNVELEALLSSHSVSNGSKLISVFSLGVAKWLLHMAEQANFSVKKLEGYCYSMFKQPPYDPNMVSICFLFEPLKLHIEDKSGLTVNPPSSVVTTKPITNHMRALQRSFAVKNLDTALGSDHATMDEMREQTKQLLRKVGYPVDDPQKGYDAWLASEPDYNLSE